jgi:glycosyltransferase involved in cell wall biosynthesis
MRIAIEAQRIFRKKKHGMDMVALELIRNLQRIDRKNEYVIFVKDDEDDQVIQETGNFRIVRLKGGFYPFWEQMALPRAVAREKCDLLHCTSNTAPVFSPVPVVDILHDIIYLEKSYFRILTDSGTLYQKFGNIYRKIIVPRVIRKCHRILTVSVFEKNRIGEFLGLKEDRKLRAVYNGVGSHFISTSPAETERIREKYRLPGKFFFFHGNTDPKKNTQRVLKAFADFRKQRQEDYKLVLTDYRRDDLVKLLAESGDPEMVRHIVLTGYVVNSDLPALYSACSLFLYPSLRESFGIPILEAMACGAPVITSQTSSMPEIAGDAALLIDPYRTDEITEAMIRIVSHPDLASQLRQKGISRSALFSWQSTARQVLEIYNEIENETR